MSGWVKVHVDWPGDPRIEQIGSDAAMMHLAALAYSARYTTNGSVPVATLRKLWPAADQNDAVDRLVGCGLWEDRGDQFYLTEWREHILPAEEVENRREQNRHRQERYRRHGKGDHSMCERCHVVTNSVTNSVSNDVNNAPSDSVPSPSPSPTPTPKGRGGDNGDAADSARATSDAAAESENHTFRADDDGHYCLDCERPAAHPIHNPGNRHG